MREGRRALTSFPVDELLAAPAAETGERTNAIELRGVSKSFGKSFGDAVALHPLDLDIRDGEFFCLLGPSGCGKTTTLNIIGGFTAPSTGVVRIAGNDMTKRPPNKRPVNTVFQSYALFPHLNVLENVSFGLRMARVKRANSERAHANRSTWSVWERSPSVRSASSPAARRNASRSLVRWSTSPVFCCSTNLSARWT